MSLETVIREVCGNLISNRSNERKKAAETLKNYLETGKAVPSLLTKNAFKKSGYNWNHVFDDIHAYIIKETEKFETSKTFHTVIAPLCTSLLHLCVTGANNGHAFIKCEKLTDACLLILVDNRLASAIGDAYLSLLYKHVLPNDNYLMYISSTTWESLLDVSISACLSKTSLLDSVMKLKLVWLVIKNATSYCQFVIPLRDSLYKIRTYIIKCINDKKLLEIEIIILLLETLSTECRLTMCEFMEAVLPPIFQFYNQNVDQKTKNSLFNMLELTIMIHHPEGRTRGIAGSLAHNWETWNKHLNCILEIVCSEIAFIQKQLDFSTQQCPHFSYVAAAIMHQIFQPAYENEDECASSSKKQKITSNNSKCFRDLINELDGNNVPWVGIIHSYVKNFGCNVTSAEYVSLILVFEKILNNDTKKINWQDYEEIACLTIDNLSARLAKEKQPHIDNFIYFWNCCIRHSGIINSIQKAVHAILRAILDCRVISYCHVEPLLAMYFEERMPVNDCSLHTLICIFRYFYSKCCSPEIKLKCLKWLINGKFTELDPLKVKEILLNLVTNKNVTLNNSGYTTYDQHEMYSNLFHTIDRNILFSEFEYQQQPVSKRKERVQHKTVLDAKVTYELHDRLELILQRNRTRMIKKDLTSLEYSKLLHLIVNFFDILLTYTTIKDVEAMNFFGQLNNALQEMYEAIKETLKSTTQIRHKISLLQCVQCILHYNYHSVLDRLIRVSIDKEFFKCINEILSSDVSKEDGEVMYEDDDMEISTKAVKHHCILLLANYCRKRERYTNELLNCILDPDLYDFKLNFDVDCAFRCIEILNEPDVEHPPLELTFTLMLDMCQHLFRNPKVSQRLLKILLQFLDRIWFTANDDSKKNIVIMIKSYLQRCTNSYYPPHTAVLVYECVAKMIKLSFNQNFQHEASFKGILFRNVNAPIHNIRLFSCYLLRIIGGNFSDSDIRSYIDSLTEIFVVNIRSKNESVLADESANRTSTLLHGFYGLAQAKQSLVHDVILRVADMQLEKSLDKNMVKKVLSLLTSEITSHTIDVYMTNNIVNMLYFWFLKSKHFYDFPVYLFGYDKDVFMEKQMKWLIAADVLWYKKGELQKSNFVKRVADKKNMTVEDIVEICFCNIMALCLPYVVSEKYNIDMDRIEGNVSGCHANRLLQITRLLLKDERWNILFVENLAELVLMTACNMCDSSDAQKEYKMNFSLRTNTFTYSKDIFLAIVKYFGEILDSNILKFLCNDQPLAVLHILNKLCGNMFKEKVLEFRVLSLHSYLIFIDIIPLGCPSDAILWNFACVGLLHAIQDSKKKEEVKIFTGGLKKVLMKILAHDANILQKPVLSKAVSVLTIKKESGFGEQCDSLLSFLTENVKEHFKDGTDVVDFISAMSQGPAESNFTVTKDEFKEKLESYSLALCHTSVETLSNLQAFLRKNRHFVNILCEELSAKGFSEECETSVIHRVISALSNIVKSFYDDKMKIEACNCLAEIGTYDLKTLVTVSPANTKKIVQYAPKQYFANVALKSCSNILFNENPSTCNKVIEAITHILRFPDGRKALDCGEIDKSVLKCLAQTQSDTSIKFPIDATKLSLHSSLDQWVPRNESHAQWVTRLTVALLDVLIAPSNYISGLREVCLAKPAVCSEILPSLIGLLIYYSSEVGALIGRQMNAVLENLSNIANSSEGEIKTLDYDQKIIVQYLLHVANFIRIQSQHYDIRRVSAAESYNYLKLDYDKLSRAACDADQHLDAIYYGELWAVACNDGVPPAGPARTSALPGGRRVQEILRKCFSAIGETDAMEGCGMSHLRSDDEKRRHLVASGQHLDALQLHDIALARDGPLPELRRGVVASLHHAGMHYLTLQYINTCPDDDALNDIKYDCLSYLGDWSVFVDAQELKEEPTCSPNSSLKAYRYTCLKDCLNMQPCEDFRLQGIDDAKLAAAKLCQSLNMENCQSLYIVVKNLHLFRDIEQYHSVRSGKLSITDFVNDWNIKKLPTFNNFKHIESLLSQRSVILDHAAKNYKSVIGSIVALQLQYAELGIRNETTQHAQRILALVRDIDTSGRVPLVESQISWSKGHKDMALSLLHDVINDPSTPVKLLAESVRQYGLWIAECKRENTRDIINKYLEKSLELSNTGNDTSTKTKVSYDIAKFADEEYKQVATYMKSHTFENKVKCMKNIKDVAATFRGTQGLTGDERKAYATNNAFGELEEAEISNTIAERQSFLIFALRYYLLTLIESDNYNLAIFRVVSLWLDNPTLDLADPDSGGLADLLHRIPSWKFLTVLPQLAPRLSNEDTLFANHLRALLSRCAVEHPHHTLPILFNLKNSDKDKCVQGSGRSNARMTRDKSPGGVEARVTAAGALVAALPAAAPALSPVLAQMERLCDATISFAYLVPNKKEAVQAVPRAEPLAALSHLDAIPVPTDAVPVRRDCDYSNITTLLSFEKYYELVGGINCPKKISCYCSDGKKRILLIKGQDDLRQDAMMQQVFNIVNTLLEKDPVTNRNKLYIRTYKVVPMSRQSGVLEWCEGTTPLGVYLVDAHSRLRPKDISSSAARIKLVECHERKISNEQKLQVFNDILMKFRPIFHFFFTEHYHDPVTWYERRLAYTRSVAASSMVGYIMGLGDRHVKNILVDECTAEVIHIDFGIAFDQGKTLRTPETVPFRLTQDIIAGFGCNGVEGVFRRCCEKTLQLLRDNQETLLTILEVLLCDPLHSWVVSEKKLRENSIQCSEEMPVGGLAERALLAVRRKLSGAAGGAAGVSARGHAARLLAAAGDPANLCRLFPGWQPYL